ncbi:hypothetical protein [Methylobacterium sp. 1973]|uniref:hypothetical protein n=1 Tax=Methylobacterium sp. 1973 TaxID=3156421 RepID=UPI0033918FCB
MSENLTLWRQIERTDPSQVKGITGKAYKGNSPKPHFLIFKATETFGPCGLGWGFEIVEEKLLDGALIAPDFHERIHMARVRVWYEWKGKRGQVEHVGQTAFCGKRNNGQTYTDEDAPKKSVTDALVKALSMIGFAGDIFMGRYDDSKYVSDIKRDFEQEAAAEQDDSRARFLNSCRQHIADAADPVALRQWWASDDQKRARRDFSLTQDEVDSLKTAFGDRLQQLAPRAVG